MSDDTAGTNGQGGIARWLVRQWVRLYYPHVQIDGAERIPASGPVLLCANHPNSLIDPVMIGLAARRPVRFLAKAPLFDVPVFGTVMKSLGMLPAYRASDDPSQVGRNVDTLAAGADLLKQGDALGIFPEGKTHDATQVDKVRSGAARIAMQAAAGGASGLKIVPLGINYEDKERFRSAVWVRVGDPIDAGAVLAEHGGDERKAMRALTKVLESRLQSLAVHLNDPKRESILHDLAYLMPPETPAIADPIAPVRQRKRIADAINFFLAAEPRRAESVSASIEMLQHCVRDAGLKLRSPLLRDRGAALVGKLLWTPLWLLALLGPALTGFFHHILPFALTRVLARAVRTPGRTTVSLARMGLGLPIYAAWYALVAWAMASYFKAWVVWAWLLPMPFAGLLALAYCRTARASASLWWHQLRMLMRGRELELDALRSDLDLVRQRVREMRKDFRKAYPVDEPAPPPPSRRATSARAVGWTLAGVGALWLTWSLAWMRPDVPEMPDAPGPALGAWSDTDLAAQLDRDEQALAGVIAGLQDLEAGAMALHAEFNAGERNYYSQEDNDVVRQLLLAYVNHRAALFRIVWRYQHHADIEDEGLRARAFLAGYTAAAVLYEASIKFVTSFNERPETIKKFNEGDATWSVPPGMYDRIRRNMAHPSVSRHLKRGMRHYDSLADVFDAHGLREAAPYADFHEAVAASARAVEELGPRVWQDRMSVTVDRSVDAGTSLAYNVQSLVATWIGDTQIRAPHHGETLIHDEDLEQLRALLEPGDVLLERRNWFLSNAFLPGYWPHAALYVGTVDDLKALGLDEDPRVKPHLAAFAKGDEHHHPFVIVEALSEGVVYASLEHSIGGGDSAAVLRPNLSLEEKKEAIARAFSHAGKAYDFEFDFFSTDKIVCTELVFRAYDGPIQFELVDVMGRKTLPAIEMVRKYVDERGTDEAQFIFIAFLDGDEKTGRCTFSDEDGFCGTLTRPALTWLQGLGGK